MIAHTAKFQTWEYNTLPNGDVALRWVSMQLPSSMPGESDQDEDRDSWEIHDLQEAIASESDGFFKVPKNRWVGDWWVMNEGPVIELPECEPGAGTRSMRFSVFFKQDDYTGGAVVFLAVEEDDRDFVALEDIPPFLSPRMRSALGAFGNAIDSRT